MGGTGAIGVFSKSAYLDNPGFQETQIEKNGKGSQVFPHHIIGITTSQNESAHKGNETSSSFCVRIRNCHLVSYNTRIYSETIRAHISVQEERKRHLVTFPSTIHPFSDLRWYSDIFVTIILLATLAGQPIQIAFYSDSMEEAGSAIISGLISIFFFVDILLNFKTGFLLYEDDAPVLDTHLIAMHYLKTGFFIDFISSIPYDCLFVTINDIEGEGELYFKYFRMLQLLKIFRLARVIRCLSRVQSAYERKNVNMRITNLVIMIFFLIHWLGCFHYLVADMVNGPPHSRGELSWVSQMEFWDHPVWEKYIHSVLRAMSNMACLGYGYAAPRAPEDVLCTIVSIIIGAFCFALFIANMSNIILNLDTSRKQYSKSLDEVNEYMQYKRIPKELRERVGHYFEQRYRRKLFNEQEIFTNISDVLRRQLQMFNCKKLVEEVPLFQGVKTEILEEIVSQLQFELYLPDDVIINMNTIGDAMYFIQHGTVHIVDSAGKVLSELSDGYFFGEMALVTNKRRAANVVARTHCDVYKLEKFDFERVIKQYPEVYESIVEIARNRTTDASSSPLGDGSGTVYDECNGNQKIERQRRFTGRSDIVVPLFP